MNHQRFIDDSLTNKRSTHITLRMKKICKKMCIKKCILKSKYITIRMQQYTLLGGASSKRQDGIPKQRILQSQLISILKSIVLITYVHASYLLQNYIHSILHIYSISHLLKIIKKPQVFLPNSFYNNNSNFCKRSALLIQLV